MIVDLFAGAGGWDIGAHAIGLEEPVGIEWDRWACATRAAAGLQTVRADVAQLDPQRFGSIDGLIASPPCQSFSSAGNGRGLDDPRGQLVYEVMRWAVGAKPRWIAAENVRAVLPIWQRMAHELRELGYATWAGLLHAADYGVPQTRVRAFLLASLDGPVAPPMPTHSREGGGLFGLRRWVSMGEALGIDLAAVNRRRTGYQGDKANLHAITVSGRPGPTVITTVLDNWELVAVDMRRTGSRGDRDITEVTGAPGPTMTTSARRNWSLLARALDLPSTTVCADPRVTARNHHVGAERATAEPDGAALFNVADLPAATVCGKAPVSNRNRVTSSQTAGAKPLEHWDGTTALRLTVDQAAALQTFPADWPFQGPKDAVMKQIGNAVPPLWAQHLLRAAAGLDTNQVESVA